MNTKELLAQFIADSKAKAASATGIIMVVCSECGAIIETKPGGEGISHSICQPCLNANPAMVDMEVRR